MPDTGESALDRVGRADVFPVLRREIIGCQQHVSIFGQLAHRLVIFYAIGCNEEVERGLSIRPRLGLPDVM